MLICCKIGRFKSSIRDQQDFQSLNFPESKLPSSDANETNSMEVCKTYMGIIKKTRFVTWSHMLNNVVALQSTFFYIH